MFAVRAAAEVRQGRSRAGPVLPRRRQFYRRGRSARPARALVAAPARRRRSPPGARRLKRAACGSDWSASAGWVPGLVWLVGKSSCSAVGLGARGMGCGKTLAGWGTGRGKRGSES
jgi:hypothetical protein